METHLAYHDFLDWFEAQTRTGALMTLENGHLHSQDEICRLPLIHAHCETLDTLTSEIDEPRDYALILMQAGRASVAVANGDEILVSKQIQKYMVRATQGRAQLNYLNEKGKSRLGSRIRLRQSEEFFDEINTRLKTYEKAYQLQQLFLSCPPKLKGFWYQASSDNPIEKKDDRWRSVPFMVRPPGEDEMFRIHRLLCRATLV